MWHQHWQSCGIDSGESSSSTYATPLGFIAIARVQGVGGHRGRQRDGRAGQLHQCAVRRHHTGQVDEALCGHVYIMQASVLDPAGRPRSVFGDRS
jgi:hypothetical protein